MPQRSCGDPIVLLDVLAPYRIRLSHPSHAGQFLSRKVSFSHSFRGYMEQIILDTSYLLRTATLPHRPNSAMIPMKQVICFCHRKSSSHSFFEEYCIYFDGKSCSHPLFE